MLGLRRQGGVDGNEIGGGEEGSRINFYDAKFSVHFVRLPQPYNSRTVFARCGMGLASRRPVLFLTWLCIKVLYAPEIWAGSWSGPQLRSGRIRFDTLCLLWSDQAKWKIYKNIYQCQSDPML